MTQPEKESKKPAPPAVTILVDTGGPRVAIQGWASEEAGNLVNLECKKEKGMRSMLLAPLIKGGTVRWAPQRAQAVSEEQSGINVKPPRIAMRRKNQRKLIKEQATWQRWKSEPELQIQINGSANSYGWMVCGEEESENVVLGYFSCTQKQRDELLKISGHQRPEFYDPVQSEREILGLEEVPRRFIPRDDKSDEAYHEEAEAYATTHGKGIVHRRHATDQLGILYEQRKKTRDYVMLAAPRGWESSDTGKFLARQGFTKITDSRAPRASSQGWRFKAESGMCESKGTGESVPTYCKMDGETAETKIRQ